MVGEIGQNFGNLLGVDDGILGNPDGWNTKKLWSWAVVVVKMTALSLTAPKIRVRIPLTTLLYFIVWKYENKWK